MAEPTGALTNPNSPASSRPRKRENLISFPNKEMPHSIMLVFKKYKYTSVEESYSLLQANRSDRQNRAARSGVDLKDSIAVQLPFPTQLVDNNSLRVGGFERDPASETIASAAAGFLEGNQGGTLRDALRGAGSSLAGMVDSAQQLDLGSGAMGALSGMSNFASGLINDILDTDGRKLARAGAYLLRSKLPGDIGKSVDTVLRSTINPRETLAFEGVNLKSHSFSWELYPSNRQDSSIIRNIVHTIKRNALPTTSDLLGGGDSGLGIAKAFLDYPSTVDVYLLGVNTEHFIKFKTCMVNDFNIDYGGNGVVSLLQGGKPAKVTLSMQLTELEIHTANEYEQGLIPPNVDDAPTDISERPAGPGGNGGV